MLNRKARRAASHVLQAAIESGFRVEGVSYPEGSYLDIGTPEKLRTAVQRAVTSGGNAAGQDVHKVEDARDHTTR